MRRQREQIAPEGFDINRKTSGGLHCVGVKPETSTVFALFAHQPANLSDGLNGSDFVVGHHHAYQDRVRPQGGANIFRSNNAILINRQAGNFPARFFQ